MSTTTTHTAVATREASELIAFLGEVVAVRVDGDDTGGAFAVLEHLLPGGLAPPLHVQAHEDETFYVLDGQLAVHLDGRESRAQTGDVIRLPRGVPHAFAVVSDGACSRSRRPLATSGSSASPATRRPRSRSTTRRRQTLSR